MITIQKEEGSIYRKALFNAIINDDFLRRFRITPNSGLIFRGTFADRIYKWCVAFYDKYQIAPKNKIRDIFESEFRKKKIPEAELEGIENVLIALDQEAEVYKEEDVDYLISEVSKMAKIEDIKNLAKELDRLVKHDELEKANELLYLKKIQAEHENIPEVDPFTDKYAVDCVFAKARQQELFSVGGALGELINAHLVPNSLIALLAPEKSGKTFFIMDLMMSAIFARQDVAVFQAGDLTDDQYFARMYAWLCGLPANKAQAKERLVPELDCLLNQRDECPRACRPTIGQPIVNLETNEQLPFTKIPANYETCDRCYQRGTKFEGSVFLRKVTPERHMRKRDAIQWQKRVREYQRGRKVKVVTFANSTLTVKKIDAIMDQWALEGFNPRVVFLDYADILAPENAKAKDGREIQDDRWRALRRLSQEKNCLLITATQSNRGSYIKETITMMEQSEDKRKTAHLTGMLTINRTAEERKKKICRVAWAVLREGDWDLDKQAVVLQDLALSKFHTASYMIDKAEEDTKKKEVKKKQIIAEAKHKTKKKKDEDDDGDE